MVQLFSFWTDRFDPADEDPNPINPIPGQALLAWLTGALSGGAFGATAPDVEDWGWYSEVHCGEARYLIGASGEPEAERGWRWMLQVHRRRSLWDRVRGRGQLASDDALVGEIDALLRAQGDFRELEVSRER